MPSYEYTCLKCKRVIRAVHSIKQDGIGKCPHCGGMLERAVCFRGYTRFIGSGFHCNDYGKEESSKS